MEAVPKLPFLSFELKTSPEATHFGPKLKQYIADVYREDPDSYSNEIYQLEALRAAAVRPTIDTAGLNKLYGYLYQLQTMQSRFPMSKGQPAAVPFSWKDLYANMSCALPDVMFEMACILYNIGALHTQLGASEPRTNPESLKSACVHFTNAAAAFHSLQQNYAQPPGLDVSSEFVRFLQEICLAQAQECVLEKSIQDTKKPNVIGAVASQVVLFYNNSLAYLGPSAGSDTLHEIIGTKLYNIWHRYLSFKSSYNGCIVSLYQGMHAEEQQKMGERVAFYQLAAEKLAKAQKLSKYIEPVQVTLDALTFTNDVVEGKRKAAKNENEFIYHDQVPDKDLLTEIKPVCLVKQVQYVIPESEDKFQDLFSRLIPIGAHEASSLYSEEKAKLLRRVVDDAEAKNMQLMEFLSSLQLDQLDVVGVEQRIPQEIVDRCAAMNAKTDIIQSLVESMNNLAEIISDVEHSLAECKNMIQSEIAKEKEYQKLMGPRPPSIVQTELSREFNKYQEAHARTTESNQVLHKAMTLHIANLKLLALPLDQLDAKIPSIDNIDGLDVKTMTEMRRVLAKAREMQKQRDLLIQELREDINGDDITDVLLSSTLEHKEVFQKEVQKHAPKVKLIEQNLLAQENVINRLTTLYASYGESRRMLSDVLRKREGLINALITSYDTHSELLGKSQKGMEFYRKLSHNISTLMARVKSTCQVQQEERTQMMATQDKPSSSAPTAAPIKQQEQIPSIPISTDNKPKLKDYLPFMKNRTLARNLVPTVQPEVLPADNYYPDAMFPTSARLPPVGSEATSDATQMKFQDGYAIQSQSPLPYNHYNPYMQPDNSYMPQTGYIQQPIKSQYDSTDANPYMQASINPYYSMNTNEQNTGYNASFIQNNTSAYNTGNQNTYSTDTVPQNSMSTAYSIGGTVQANAPTNMSTSVHNATQPNVPSVNANMTPTMVQLNAYNAGNQTVVPQSQNYEQYPINQSNNQYYQTDLSSSFSQMQVSEPKEENVQYGGQIQYPYSIAGTTTVSQNPVTPNEYNPYSYGTTDQNYSVTPASNVQYQPNADTISISSNQSFSSVNKMYEVPESSKNDPSLAAIDAMDKPIKSHVTAQTIPTLQSFQNQNFYANQPKSVTFNDPNYSQSFQNHPGYNFNSSTGNYDYNYGSQNAYMSSQNDPNTQGQVTNMYTSAGACQTVQSGSQNETFTPQDVNNQMYYNSPYGYQTTVPNQMVPSEQTGTTNYGADLNHSTYMQSGQNVQPGPNTAVTYTNNQASTAESAHLTNEQNYQVNYQVAYNTQNTMQYSDGTFQNDQINNQNFNNENTTYNYQPVDSYQSIQNEGETQINYENQEVPYNNQNTPYTTNIANTYQNNEQNYTHHIQELNPYIYEHHNNAQIPENIENNQQATKENKPNEIKNNDTEIKAETQNTEDTVSSFDLLSGIDFTLHTQPLMPHISVPQVSESSIKKYTIDKPEVVKIEPKVEEIVRPAKRDLFSDPSLVNKFTEEVKVLKAVVDGFGNSNMNGLSNLDALWLKLMDEQKQEYGRRSKSVAEKHNRRAIVAEVVPYDDSRLIMENDPDVYINASVYKQLSSWCIPLVISSSPIDFVDHFWTAILENNVTCIVCLQSEIEMQGNCYWPTAIGHSISVPNAKVTLEEVTCNVHWTERQFNVTGAKSVISVTQIQINVFPAKIVCAPLVSLASRILSLTYDNLPSTLLGCAWLHCASGGGRSAVVALLLMVLCQVRAGLITLTDTLESGCKALHKNRLNILEDAKHLSDAYRSALFYVQGVLCSGTTKFTGEAVITPSAQSVIPPVTPTATQTDFKIQKFSKESFEEMKQSGMKTSDMKDPLNFLDPLWSLKKK